jgi:hypothetical protein
MRLTNPSSNAQDFFLYSERVLFPLHVYSLHQDQLTLLGGVSPQTIDQRLDKDLGTVTLPLSLEAGEEKTILIQFQRTIPISSPRLWLHTKESYRQLLVFENASRYTIIGITLTMLAYNFFLAIKFKQAQYTTYVAYLFFFLVNIIASNLHILAASSSLLIRQIHPHWTGMTTDLVYLFASLFCIAFLRLPREDRIFAKILYGFVFVFAVQALLSIVHPVLSSQLRTVSGLLGGPLLFFAGVRAIQRGYPPARYFTLGWGIAILSNCGWILAGIGLIPNSFWVDWGVSYGAVTEMFVLSLALSSRFQMEQSQAKAKIQELNQSLEHKVQEKTAEIRRLLEHTHLGLLSVEQNLTIHKDYSKHLEVILETPKLSGQSIWDVLFSKALLNEEEKSRARCALEYSIGDHVMFYDANLEILPKRLTLNLSLQQKIVDLAWSAIINAESLVERILLGITDVTSQIKAEAEAEVSRLRLQCVAELLDVGALNFQGLIRDLTQLLEDLKRRLDERTDLHTVFLQLHTLKSRARLEKYLALTASLHELESQVQLKPGKNATPAAHIRLSMNKLEATLALYQEAIHSIGRFQQNVPQPLPQRLSLLLDSYRSMLDHLAKDLGKGNCRLIYELTPDWPLERDLQTQLETILVHIFRNILDHGAETPAERQAKQKPPELTIRVWTSSPHCLTIQDDGRGLNLQKLAARAKAAHLAYGSLTELANLVFHSGFSTKDSVDHISGRGVGMEVVRATLQAAGGDAWIEPLGETSPDGFLPFRLHLQFLQSSRLAS